MVKPPAGRAVRGAVADLGVAGVEPAQRSCALRSCARRFSADRRARAGPVRKLSHPGNFSRHAERLHHMPLSRKPARQQRQAGQSHSDSTKLRHLSSDHDDRRGMEIQHVYPCHVPSNACAGCHNGIYGGGKPANHIPTTADCSTCHASTVAFSAGVTGGIMPANHIPTTQACTQCHTGAKFIPGVMNHTGITSGCVTCHAVGASGKVFAGVTPLPQGAGHLATSADCSTCHTSTVSFSTGVTGGKPANHIPTTQACTLCHANGNLGPKSGVMNHSGITSGCTTCHAASATGLAFFGVTPVAQGAGHIRDDRGLRDVPQVDHGVRSGHGDEPHGDHERVRELPRHGQELHGHAGGGGEAGEPSTDARWRASRATRVRTSPRSVRARR